MELVISKKHHEVYVFDEYNDLRNNNKILNFILVFRELELLLDSKDYLLWCKQQSIDANNNELRGYYISINKFLSSFEGLNFKITSFIPDLDFQLNSGAMSYLRNDNAQ